MDKYKISEIAKKFDITRTALIHYDNCGLLSPSIRNDNNYRYYTSEDILKLELILALKESGLTLKEIQSYLSEESNQTSIDLLNQQVEALDKKILLLKLQRRIIKKRVEKLEKFKKIEVYDGIHLSEYPEMTIIKESIGYGPLMSYDSAVARLRKKLKKEGQLTSKFGICFDISSSDSQGKYEMKYIFDYLSIEGYKNETTTLAANKFIRCLHKGKYTTVENTIDRLLSHAIKKEYTICGDAYFVPLFDYWESISDDFIGEVLIPVNCCEDNLKPDC